MSSQRPQASPEPAPKSSSLPFPKWVLWLSMPGIIAPPLIFVFIFVSERAHDPSRCPFQEHERRELSAEVSIVEETRSCVPDVEERRFVLHRAGATQLLGERRLPKAAFAADAYTWKASLTAQGEAQVDLENRGHGVLRFREGTAADKKHWDEKAR